MRAISLFSDYELVEKYKQNKHQKKILEHFWIKYQPLIKKKVNNYFRSNPATMDFDDYCQDSYFHMIKALDNIKLSKIRNKELFSFGQYLKNYLRSYNRLTYRKESRRLSRTDYIDAPIEYDNEECSYALNRYVVAKENVEKDFLTKEFQSNFKKIFREFFDECNYRERKLLNLCIDKNTLIQRDMYYHIKKASKFLKVQNRKASNDIITKQHMFQSINKLKRKFIDHMQKYGYYSNSSLTNVGLTKLV